MAHNVTSRNLTLTWVEPHDNNAPISGYRVSYVQPVFLGGDTVTLNVSADSSVSSGSLQDFVNSFLFIDDLHPGSTYMFTVIAFNIIGDSVPSAPFTQIMVDEGNIVYNTCIKPSFILFLFVIVFLHLFILCTTWF